MKKPMIVIILALCLISFCGCVENFYFDYESLQNNVESIEIIEYSSDTQKEVLLVSIGKAEQEQLLRRLSELEYFYVWGDPLSPEGICIKLNYKNNESEIVSYAGTTQNGFIKCDKTLFEDMLQNYLR